jgi:hypothetical protein
MKWHVFAATALLFLVTLACRNRTPMRVYDAGSAPTSVLEPSPVVDDEPGDKVALTAKVETIDKISAMKLPQVTSVSTLKAKGPKPKLNGFDYPATAAIIDWKSIGLAKDYKSSAIDATDLWWCAQLTRGAQPSIDKSKRDACKGFRYLVAMRFSTRVNPRMTSGNTYQGGHASGDATVFDLESSERLGAVPFSCVNADKLEAMQGVELGRAVADLETQCAAVVNDEIGKAWPAQ